MNGTEMQADGHVQKAQTPGRWARALMWAMWPSFLMAGVTEALVFSVLDPSDMSAWGGEPLGWSRQAVYTVSFLLFWLLCGLSSSISLFLALSPEPRDGDAHEAGVSDLESGFQSDDLGKGGQHG